MANQYLLTFLLALNKYKKKGPPNKAVIIPTGISIGEIIVRAMVSANTIKMPPINAEAGRRILLSAPNRILATWGMIKPTNPIIPDMDTAMDTMKVPKTKI